MSDGVSREEFHGFIGMIQKGQDENNKELRELTRNVNLFVVAASKNEEQTRHLSHEVSEVKEEISEIKKDQIKPIREAVHALQTKASNNMLRWAFLISLTTIILGMSTWAYTTFRQPQADVKAAIEEQTKIEAAILEYLQGDDDGKSN